RPYVPTIKLFREYKLPIAAYFFNAASRKPGALIVEFHCQLRVAAAQGIVYFLTVIKPDDLGIRIGVKLPGAAGWPGAGVWPGSGETIRISPAGGVISP